MTYKLGIICYDTSGFNYPNIIKDELVIASGSLLAMVVAYTEVFMIFYAEDSSQTFARAL